MVGVRVWQQLACSQKAALAQDFLLQRLDSNSHACLKCFSCLHGLFVTASADLTLLLGQHGVSPAAVPQQLIHLVHDFLM